MKLSAQQRMSPFPFPFPFPFPSLSSSSSTLFVLLTLLGMVGAGTVSLNIVSTHPVYNPYYATTMPPVFLIYGNRLISPTVATIPVITSNCLAANTASIAGIANLWSPGVFRIACVTTLVPTPVIVSVAADVVSMAPDSAFVGGISTVAPWNLAARTTVVANVSYVPASLTASPVPVLVPPSTSALWDLRVYRAGVNLPWPEPVWRIAMIQTTAELGGYTANTYQGVLRNPSQQHDGTAPVLVLFLPDIGVLPDNVTSGRAFVALGTQTLRLATCGCLTLTGWAVSVFTRVPNLTAWTTTCVVGACDPVKVSSGVDDGVTTPWSPLHGDRLGAEDKALNAYLLVDTVLTVGCPVAAMPSLAPSVSATRSTTRSTLRTPDATPSVSQSFSRSRDPSASAGRTTSPTPSRTTSPSVSVTRSGTTSPSRDVSSPVTPTPTATRSIRADGVAFAWLQASHDATQNISAVVTGVGRLSGWTLGSDEVSVTGCTHLQLRGTAGNDATVVLECVPEATLDAIVVTITPRPTGVSTTARLPFRPRPTLNTNLGPFGHPGVGAFTVHLSWSFLWPVDDAGVATIDRCAAALRAAAVAAVNSTTAGLGPGPLVALSVPYVGAAVVAAAFYEPGDLILVVNVTSGNGQALVLSVSEVPVVGPEEDSAPLPSRQFVLRDVRPSTTASMSAVPSVTISATRSVSPSSSESTSMSGPPGTRTRSPTRTRGVSPTSVPEGNTVTPSPSAMHLQRHVAVLETLRVSVGPGEGATIVAVAAAALVVMLIFLVVTVLGVWLCRGPAHLVPSVSRN
jgi:hypothetical protein